MNTPFFSHFRVVDLPLKVSTVHAEVGGNGPPVLLLHGYPQTHVAWHRIASDLAREFTVVAPDLRGYGDSVGPKGGERHVQYSKRAMALDALALMKSLGFENFAVIGHDRGGRVGYRMALDHPGAVRCFSSLTVIPTSDMWERAGMAFGLKAYHWYLFAQPFDLPERLLAADPAYFLRWTLQGMTKSADAVSPLALAEYDRAFARASVRHAMLEDYRAAADIDLEHDRLDIASGRRLQCPVQVLWSEGQTAQPNPLETWRKWADQPEGGTVLAGHLLAEEAPAEVLAWILPFLRRNMPR
ncbi:alpha/beta fold hydrolase [Pseudorhodoferax sp.]|uniref:alpha/beta fold hydrolase n=1 Tax=Pseudorhodoferax sp. TaxID=1993553 RepID=UPI0039E44269